MKGDRGVCMAAVAQDGDALKYCSTGLQLDRKIRTLATVRKKGQALKDALEEMKGDCDVCMAAVAQDWRALQHCSEEMKGDSEVVITALKQGPLNTGGIYELTSHRAKTDE